MLYLSMVQLAAVWSFKDRFVKSLTNITFILVNILTNINNLPTNALTLHSNALQMFRSLQIESKGF